jgi:hypothetical protein
MSINRNALYTELFERLKGIQGVGTVERTLRHIDNVAPEEMPYIGLFIRNQARVAGAGHLPGKYSLPFELFVYASRKDTDTDAASLLNDILDAIDRALEASHNWPGENLGSAAHAVHMRVEGTIELDSAPLGEQAMAIVPGVIIAAG